MREAQTRPWFYYFGCIGRPGHYMHDPDLRTDYDALERTPWGTAIDGKLCPKNTYQPEGLSSLHHKDGWTALSFWDRTGDKRGNSNSAFLAEGTFTFEEMLTNAREIFPSVMERFKFSIVLAETEEEGE